MSQEINYTINIEGLQTFYSSVYPGGRAHLFTLNEVRIDPFQCVEESVKMALGPLLSADHQEIVPVIYRNKIDIIQNTDTQLTYTNSFMESPRAEISTIPTAVVARFYIAWIPREELLMGDLSI